MKDWRIINGAFIGKVLVLRDIEGTGVAGKMLPKKEEGWIPYAVDLRVVSTMKQDGFADGPEPERAGYTALYHNGSFIATVNAPFEELLPHWLSHCHVFQTQAYVPAEDFKQAIEQE